MNILYISPYYSTFIHNPILNLMRIKQIDTYTFFPKNLYLYFRKRNYRNNYKENKLTHEIPNENQKQFFYYGLPQDVNSHNYPEQIGSRIDKLINVSQFDLIHAHTIFPAGISAMYLAEKYNIPFIITSHGMDFYRCFPHNHTLSRGIPYKEKESKLIKTVMSQVNALVCVSEEFASDVRDVFPNSNIAVIENSYDYSLFKPEDKKNIRKKLHLSEERKMILSVGHFIPEKGHLFLLEALKQVVKKIPNILLVLIGNGIYKTKYKEMIKRDNINNNVILLEPMQQSELAKYYQAADIFVLPSLSESFGLSLVEAMACGLPAIATKTQGPIQIVDNEINGFLIEKENSDEITSKIEILFNDQILYNKMSINAAKSMLKKYAYKDLELFMLYQQIIKQSSRVLNVYE